MFQAIVIAFQALASNKMRSTLTMLGTVIGVTCVVALWNIGQSGRAFMNESLESIGQNLIFVSPKYSADENDKDTRSSRFHPLTLGDVAAIQDNCPSVEAASPMMQNYSNITFGAHSHHAEVLGCFPNYLSIRVWKLHSGSVFSDADSRGRARVVLIGSQLARELFGTSDPLGERVRVDKNTFTIIGVLKEKGSMFGRNQDDVLMMPYETLEECMGWGRNIYQIFVSAKTREGIPNAKHEIVAAIRQSHKVPPGRKDPVDTHDLGEMSQAVDGVLVGATMLLGAIGAISLLVGGIGIMNIMLVSVTERTREIGLRMALGATDANILLQFLVEAMTLSGVGGVVGAAFGLAVTVLTVKIIGLFSHSTWPLVLSPFSVAVAVVFSMFVGVFFGFYPAWRASRLDPIVALRRE